MENELDFRIVLVVLFLGFIAHRIYYSRKLARPDSETIAKDEEKSFLMNAAALLSLLGLAALIAYIVNPTWMSWSSRPLPAWLRRSGVGVALLGFVLLQWSHQALGRNWSDEPRLLTGQGLVRTGPYRWIRHPIYSAFLLIFSSPLLISANWFLGAMWIGMATLDVLRRIRIEEAMLVRHFGDEYRVYMKVTGRLLPRITGASDPHR
ncbi:MAG: isoprenylcysteine carboxylmethyltransferase family protein [Planctomycetota bacterium]|nr:isoprenylcysteine carboxylmethyltransferase family protein [Planctomycetota bacterium]